MPVPDASMLWTDDYSNLLRVIRKLPVWLRFIAVRHEDAKSFDNAKN